IEGRLRTRSWEDQSGQRRYMTEVNGNQMLMLDSKGQGGGASGGPRNESKRPNNDSGRGQSNSFPEADDDLPF
ncbi:MAG: single-stranded DNA-binding protein, partial [Candidatus Latescibacteria bacterium]|nr:single-stranded DNA-binding protein [Candidatus Latescibacterota bacterium]